MNDLLWPPKYQVRHSARAKQLFLQISPVRGLEVVVPQRKRNKNIDSELDLLLKSKRRWVERHLKKLQGRVIKEPVLPDSIELKSINELILIQYQNPIAINPILKIKIKIKEIPTLPSEYVSFLSQKMTILQVTGPIENKSGIIMALKRWLKKKGERHLIPWLQEESARIGMPYSSARIRCQSTLWGSCTPAHKISLNLKLMFMPKEITRYVIVHELCHTKYLNHSKRFWNLVEKHDPNWRMHRKILREGDQRVPRWIL